MDISAIREAIQALYEAQTKMTAGTAGGEKQASFADCIKGAVKTRSMETTSFSYTESFFMLSNASSLKISAPEPTAFFPALTGSADTTFVLVRILYIRKDGQEGERREAAWTSAQYGPALSDPGRMRSVRPSSYRNF